jgi:hypothetical protein
MRRPSIQVGDQPCQTLSSPITLAPSMQAARHSQDEPMVMSAVSSVSTPGVLVTVMPLAVAVSTSILSTPVAEIGDQLELVASLHDDDLSILSVTVGTSTSAFCTASTSSSWLIGSSVSLSVVANSSRIRVSTTSGSLRVTRGLSKALPVRQCRRFYG